MKKQAEDFIAKVAIDPDLRSKLEALTTLRFADALPKIITLGEAAGFPFSEQDFLEAARTSGFIESDSVESQETQLSDEDLEQVSGGDCVDIPSAPMTKEPDHLQASKDSENPDRWLQDFTSPKDTGPFGNMNVDWRLNQHEHYAKSGVGGVQQ